MPATRSRSQRLRPRPFTQLRRAGTRAAARLRSLDAPEEPVAKGQPVLLVVVVQELVLQLRHVHVGRALGLAALALQAEVHDLVEPRAP